LPENVATLQLCALSLRVIAEMTLRFCAAHDDLRFISAASKCRKIGRDIRGGDICNNQPLRRIGQPFIQAVLGVACPRFDRTVSPRGIDASNRLVTTPNSTVSGVTANWTSFGTT